MKRGVKAIKVKGLAAMELSGGPYERGYKYGETCKRLIARMIEEQFYHELGGRMTKNQTLRHARKYGPFVEEYSPEIAEELKGMADGCGRSYDEIVMVNAHEEREGFRPSHCTVFAATGGATIGGETYQGQTWDGAETDWWDGKFGLLFKVRRKNGPDILDYTNPGLLACSGLNAKGIGVSWNTVPRIEMTVGVPTYIIVAEVLKQDTVEEALDVVVGAKRAGCFNFVITDDKDIYNVEATPSEVAVTRKPEYIGHANHFVSDGLRMKQNMADAEPSSATRQDRINRLLKENYGKIDLRMCIKFMRDHMDYPSSICSHPGEKPDPNRRLTLDSWISVPSKREFWIAHGPPCENKFKKFGI